MLEVIMHKSTEPKHIRLKREHGNADFYHVYRRGSRLSVHYVDPHGPDEENIIFSIGRRAFLAAGDRLLETGNPQRGAVRDAGSDYKNQVELRLDYSDSAIITIIAPCGQEHDVSRDDFKWLLDCVEFEL